MERIEKTVFISYRRRDVSWALAVFQNLQHHEYDCFLDYEGLASGDFERVILENIKSRAHFLVLLTPSALDRCSEPNDWLRREVEAAISTRRNVVPLMIEGFKFKPPHETDPRESIADVLKRYNALEMHAAYFDAAMNRLRDKFFNVPLHAVLHPASQIAEQAARHQQAAALTAAAIGKNELGAQHADERQVPIASDDSGQHSDTDARWSQPEQASDKAVADREASAAEEERLKRQQAQWKAEAEQQARDNAAADQKSKIEAEQKAKAKATDEEKLKRQQAQWKAEAEQQARDNAAADQKSKIEAEQKAKAKAAEEERLKRQQAQWKAEAEQQTRDRVAADQKSKFKAEQTAKTKAAEAEYGEQSAEATSGRTSSASNESPSASRGFQTKPTSQSSQAIDSRVRRAAKSLQVAATAFGAIAVLAISVSSWLFVLPGQGHSDEIFAGWDISACAGFLTIFLLIYWRRYLRRPTRFTASTGGLIIHSLLGSVSYSWDHVGEISVSNSRFFQNGIVLSWREDGKTVRKKFHAPDGRSEELAWRLRDWQTSYLEARKI